MSRFTARAQFEWVSYSCVRWPNMVGRLVMGAHPVRWRLMDTPAEAVPNWQERPGCRTPGFLHFLPSRFRHGVLLSAPEEVLGGLVDAMQDQNGVDAFPAVAFRVGQEVLATVIPPQTGTEQGQLAYSAGREAVILGVGQGSLQSTLGAYQPEARLFRGAESGVYVSQSLPLGDLRQEHSTVQHI